MSTWSNHFAYVFHPSPRSGRGLMRLWSRSSGEIFKDVKAIDTFKGAMTRPTFIVFSFFRNTKCKPLLRDTLRLWVQYIYIYIGLVNVKLEEWSSEAIGCPSTVSPMRVSPGVPCGQQYQQYLGKFQPQKCPPLSFFESEGCDSHEQSVCASDMLRSQRFAHLHKHEHW